MTGSQPYSRKHKPEEQAGGVGEIAGQDKMTCGWCDQNVTSVNVLQDHIIQEHSIKALPLQPSPFQLLNDKLIYLALDLNS